MTSDVYYVSPLGNVLIPLMRERGLNASRLSTMAGLSRTAVRDIVEGRSKNPDTTTLVSLAEVLGVPLSTLILKPANKSRAVMEDSLPTEPPKPVHRGPKYMSSFLQSDDIPVYASAQGGPDGTLLTFDVIETVKRPAPLLKVQNGFGMYVTGTSMSPAFEPGDMLLCNASNKPPRAGDDVLLLKVSEDGTHSALVKRYVRGDDRGVTVEQFNPPMELHIQRDELFAVHIVVGKFSR